MKQKKNGFTLLELLIVIGILAILSTLVLTIVDPLAQFRKASDARRKSDLGQIQKALEQYYQDNGAYPTGTPDYRITNPELTPIPWGSTWPPYLDVLPSDPESPSRSYMYVSTGQSYWIYASLERGGSDTQACKATLVACANNPLSASCLCDNTPTQYCGGNNICTYGVSSPNTQP